jgi:hypothetical protein
MRLCRNTINPTASLVLDMDLTVDPPPVGLGRGAVAIATTPHPRTSKTRQLGHNTTRHSKI